MGGGDVLMQQAEGRGARGTGEVELGKLALGEGGGKPTPSLPIREGDAGIVGIHNGYSYRFSIYLNWLLSRNSLPPPFRYVNSATLVPLKGRQFFLICLYAR